MVSPLTVSIMGARLGNTAMIVPVSYAATFVFVAVVDMSALAGTLDGGGLGAFALDYGYKRWNDGVVWVTVLVIIVLVQVAQAIGNRLSRWVLRR